MTLRDLKQAFLILEDNIFYIWYGVVILYAFVFGLLFFKIFF